MIRTATAQDFQSPITDEARLRLYALWEAYGEVPFIRYYADGEGGLLSLMDGVGFFSPGEAGLSEEWTLFLRMEPALRQLRCPAEIGEELAKQDGFICRTGELLRFEGSRPERQPGVCDTPSLPAVYPLLERCFPIMPPLDAWYPDVSHRLRHGCCMMASIVEENRVVSTAMTVAQSGEHALLGQVATDEAYRCRGYAAACLKDLISRWQGDNLYIIPANENARKLYIKLGFRPWDTWAELTCR